jgi:UDP-2,3-diacylglucosamine hydrolase
MNRVGLIAGNGRFPSVFARGAREAGVEVVAVAHLGETEPGLDELVSSVTWIKVGELGKIIDTFKTHGLQRAVMAGGIRKATLFENFAPDERAIAFLSRLPRLGDDTILRGIAGELESEGIAVVDSTIFIPALMADEGSMTEKAPSEAQWSDIHYGVRVARAVGRWDVGQSVVVKGGMVLAVEAIEGTDAAIRRGAALGKSDVVVVKISKPGQDLRFDVPAVGRDTIAVCVETGVSVLALEAGRTLMLDKRELLADADARGIAVVGVRVEEAA